MKLKSCLLQAPILVFSRRGLVCARCFTEIGRSSLIMPAVVSSYPSDVIVLHCEICWRLLQCVLIFARTYGARSSLCSLITSPSGGCKSFAILVACYLGGTCFSASSLGYLRISTGAQHANTDGLSHQCGKCLRTDCPVSLADVGSGETGSTSELVDRGRSMLTQMAFLINAASAYVQTLRCRRRMLVLVKPAQHRNWWTNLSPLPMGGCFDYCSGMGTDRFASVVVELYR